VPTTSSERKLYADRHRRREEVAIRELDGAAAAAHRAKRARLQKGLREQRQDVDEEKVLRSVLERCISQLEREADAERRRTDCVQRLSLAGYPNLDRARLQIGDLIYVASDSPAPYVRFVQLAVLRRAHRSGCKVDVQLCEVSPPEMGTIGVDRVRLAAWLRGLHTASVLGPVQPRIYPRHIPCSSVDMGKDRSTYPRELWPTLQLWSAADQASCRSGIRYGKSKTVPRLAQVMHRSVPFLLPVLLQ